MRDGMRRSAGAVVLSACVFAAACGDDESPKPGVGGGGQGGASAGEGGATGDGGTNATSGGSAGKAGGSSGGSANSGGAAGSSAGDAGTGGAPVPIFCGNGIVDGDDECERRVGCDPGEQCSATCTCEPGPPYTPSSQELIQRALDAGDIDYPTSLMYRVWALFQAPELPEAYDGSGSIGEDTYLFFELSRVRGTLPAEIEAAIAPYLVRPDDPASIFSQPPVLPYRKDAPLPAPPDASQVLCPLNAEGMADWRPYETTNFVVWSCGGGVEGTDPFEAKRIVAGDAAEEAYAELRPKLDIILPDEYPVGPEPRNRIDIYIVELNRCRFRAGNCVQIQGTTMAAAAPTQPCGEVFAGPIISSAYMVVGADRVPDSPADAAKLRYIMAHEVFHAISYGLNLGAQGGTCRDVADPVLPPDQARSWLTEASAEWASAVLFADDFPDRRTNLFAGFQEGRNVAEQGLHETTGIFPYQAYLYPFFVREELAAPDKFFQFWTGSGSARTREDLDHRLNATLSFAGHFRDFAVRNFNADLPGSPIDYPHSGWDESLPFDDPRAYVPEPSPELAAPLEISVPLRIAPLGADYLHYSIADETRSFRLDASALGSVQLDAIIKVGDGWRRERVTGPIFDICRDKPENDVEELYLVVSNFDFDRAGRAAGDLKVTTHTACAGGWTGYIRVTQTTEETRNVSDEFMSEVENGRTVETQEWSFAGSMPYMPAGSVQSVDRARAAFRGHTSGFSETVTTQGECTEYYIVEESGNGGYSYFWDFSPSPSGPGTWMWTVAEMKDGYKTDFVTTIAACEGTMAYPQEHAHGEMWGYLGLAPGLATLVEDPSDPGHFTGNANPIHSETPGEGGMTLIDIKIEWELRRIPEP